MKSENHSALLWTGVPLCDILLWTCNAWEKQQSKQKTVPGRSNLTSTYLEVRRSARAFYMLACYSNISQKYPKVKPATKKTMVPEHDMFGHSLIHSNMSEYDCYIHLFSLFRGRKFFDPLARCIKNEQTSLTK